MQPIQLQTSQKMVVHFPDDGASITLPMTCIGDGLYRIDGIPAFVESARYRDIVRAVNRADGALQVVTVVEQSKWKTYSVGVLESRLTSQEGEKLLAELSTLGIHWEIVLSNLLMLALPPEMDADPTEWLPVLGGTTAFLLERH